MGKKTRTRRTKWRRLSLGEASEGEEDEQQQQQQPKQQQPEQQEEQELVTPQQSDNVCTPVDDHCAEQLVVSESSVTAAAVVSIMPGHPEDRTGGGTAWKPAHHQAPVKSGAYQYPSHGNFNGYAAAATSGRPGGGGAPAFRRGGGGGAPNSGPRYANNYNSNNSGYGGGAYGRANSWNSNNYNDHHHSNHPGGLGKTHGIEKKIFNDEEYTKISTPRQEVLFKKGSIGAKKRSPAAATTTGSSTTAASPTATDGEDSQQQQQTSNLNAASPTSPVRLSCDSDSFHYSGNDSGSTGDASSTAGEAQSPDAAGVAALQQGYDGTPLVCIPMYDFYGGYGGMYPGSMLVQTYPGGPLVAAVPVQMPLWNGAPGAGGPNGHGEMGFYYALGYPATGEMPGQPDAGNSSRRNSVESYQASSQEAMTGSEGSSSENSSPCSTGPSSQGPASPQGEMVSPVIDPKAQTGGAAVTAAAAAAVVMADMAAANTITSLDNRPNKMAVAGFVYPAFPYGIAPPALYASGY